jgi:hypothetical protein
MYYGSHRTKTKSMTDCPVRVKNIHKYQLKEWNDQRSLCMSWRNIFTVNILRLLKIVG